MKTYKVRGKKKREESEEDRESRKRLLRLRFDSEIVSTKSQDQNQDTSQGQGEGQDSLQSMDESSAAIEDNFQQETDYYYRTGLIELWPYSLRKPPPLKVNLNHNTDNFETKFASTIGTKTPREAAITKFEKNDVTSPLKGRDKDNNKNLDGGVSFVPITQEVRTLKDQKIEKLQKMLALVGKEIQIIEDIADGKVDFDFKRLENKEKSGDGGAEGAGRAGVEGPILVSAQGHQGEDKGDENYMEDLMNVNDNFQCNFVNRNGGQEPSIEGEEDMILCPWRCGLVILRKKLPYHQQFKCGSRIISCPLPGCKDKIRAGDVKKHIKEECLEADRRNQMALLNKQKRSTIDCPQGCGLQILKKEMVDHVENHCSHRIVKCNLHGCKVEYPLNETTKHLKKRCKAMKERDFLIKELKKHHAIVECSLCGISLQSYKMPRHIKEDCGGREVPCPYEGCNVLVRYDRLEHHFRRCKICLENEEKASIGKLKRLNYECPACGEVFPKRHLMQHDREECVNRRVPCKNWECGCHQLIRVKDKGIHESVDHLMRPRPCLEMISLNAQINLLEQNIQPPWTAEFVVMPGNPLRRAKILCRVALEKYGYYCDAVRYLKDCEAKLRDLQNEQIALSKASKGKRGGPEVAEKVQQLVNQLVEQANVLHQADAEVEIAEYYASDRILAASRTLDEMAKKGIDLIKLIERTGQEEELRSLAQSNESTKSSLRRGSSFYKKEGDDDNDGDDDNGDDDHGDENNEEENLFTSTEEGQQANEKNVEKNEGREGENNKDDGNKEDNNDVDRRDSIKNSQINGEGEVPLPEVDEASILARLVDFNDPFAAFTDGILLATEIHRLASKFRERYLQKCSNRLKGDKKSETGEAKKLSRKEKKKLEREKKRKEEHGYSAEELMFQATAGQLGWSCIASSEDFKIFLEIGVNDEVGITHVGVNEYKFPFTLPRDKWTHLTFVATAPPRRRLICYANGEEVGHIDGITPNLPMQYIGDPQRSFMGYVQEVRYWTVQRTEQEIKKYMHSLVPMKEARAHGIKGWWTMEEEKGEFLYDVSEQRYRIKMGEMRKDLLWKNQEQIGIAPITPAFRESLVCPVELKRAKLAMKGRALLQEVPCPLECGENVMKKNLAFHQTYLCRCRLVVCTLPNCGVAYKLNEKEVHEREECEYAAIRNRILKKVADDHIIKNCPLGCGEPVFAMNFDDHKKNHCPRRWVYCDHDNCGIGMPFFRLKPHMTWYCDFKPPKETKIDLSLIAKREERAKMEEYRTKRYEMPWRNAMKEGPDPYADPPPTPPPPDDDEEDDDW